MANHCIGKLGRFHWFMLLFGAMTWTAGCSAPKAELGAYITAFDEARTVTTDLLLEARLKSEQWAVDPANDRPVPARLEQLERTRAAIDVSIAGLGLIADYNAALTGLLVGADPAAVQGDLDRLLTGLSAFNSKSLSGVVADVVPYGQVISLAIALVDDLIRRAQFEQAVREGAPAVKKAMEALKEASAKLGEIEESFSALELERTVKRDARLQSAAARRMLASFDPVALKNDPELNSACDRINKRLSPILSLSSPFDVRSSVTGTNVIPAEPAKGQLLASLAVIERQAEALEERATIIEAQVKAYSKVITEYRALLDSVMTAMDELHTSLDRNRIDGAIDVAGQVLKLRQAVIALRMERDKR